MGSTPLTCSWAIHQGPPPEVRGAHATALACAGAPAQRRKTPAHVAHVSPEPCPCGCASGVLGFGALAARFQGCHPGARCLGIAKPQRIRGTTACFPLSSSSPTKREGRLLHTAREAAHIKKPQPGMVGVGTYTLPPLSLERTSQRHVGQVSWLAAYPYSLHLPKAKRLSGFCRFRSAHSCGAAMDLHHLPWSQSQSVTNPTSGIYNSGG